MPLKIVRNCRSGSRACVAGLLILIAPTIAPAQQASVSAWDAADFRIWAYIPYWATTSQINGFATNGLYTHVSDVFHFGGLRPDASGNLTWASSSYQTQFNTIRTQAASNGFKFHLSMFEVTGGATNTTWESIIVDPTKRANFVSQLKTVMQGGAGSADDLKGFNFDWERPSNQTEWGNYTQLARELRTAINPLGMEVSVCDYGSTDTTWDNTSLFDAKVYDQLLMMSYHLTASSSGTYANTKKALTDQGSLKAFSDDQIGVGFGSWGDGVGTEPTASLQSIVAANPNLPYDALTYSGTINGTTGTWNIESRKQVREKTQLALDRNMPGMFSWTLHYDATNNLGLHRVIHHYTVVKRDVPDLNLDGNVNATDATTLANNMGMVLTNTGMTLPAQFDAFYLAGNWEKGDHDGNGFVNQQDADWFASRYAALGVTMPDRLAYSGTFESFGNSKGLTGRWRAGRDAQNKLTETSNFKQEATNFLTWSGTGLGASQRSNGSVTIRNQNTAEAAAATNVQTRFVQADLTNTIDLGQNKETFFTFLVRENTGSLSASQLASSNRVLSLQFLNSSGVDQFDFTIRGMQQQFSILSQADAAGQDVSSGGFASNAVYLVVGKIVGNGAGANTLAASFFSNGAAVADFWNPNFQWMLTAQSSGGYNPLITDVQFASLFESSFTVSNLWIGDASLIPEPATVWLLLTASFTLLKRSRQKRNPSSDGLNAQDRI